MSSPRRSVVYGFLIWLVPLIVSFVIFGWHESERPLFESIMAVAVTATTAVLGIFYLRSVTRDFLREGIAIGVTWYVIAVVIDLLMFMWGPEDMRMTFADYMKDIGITYLIIPVVTIALGYALAGGRTASGGAATPTT
jgi:uncharacterized membrane protein YpjA